MRHRWGLVGAMVVVAVGFALGSPVPAAADLLQEVLGRGTVRVGLRTANVPFGFFDKRGNHIGFDVDISQAIIRRLSKKFKRPLRMEKVPVDALTRIAFIIARKIDMAAATMTHTRSRDENIDFTITYFFDGQRMLARKGEFKSLKEFVGHKISTVQGTTSEQNVEKLLRDLGDPNPRILSFQQHPEAFMALKQGKVDGYTTDSTILLGTARGDPGVELVGKFFSNEPYGIGLPENESNWRDELNFALQDIWRDGTYKTIYNRWFGPKTLFHMPLTRKLETWP